MAAIHATGGDERDVVETARIIGIVVQGAVENCELTP